MCDSKNLTVFMAILQSNFIMIDRRDGGKVFGPVCEEAVSD